MNPKRLVLAVAVLFVFVFATDFLIHGVWLKDTYARTAGLWRPEAEMQKYFGWLLLSQFLIAAVFVALWARGFAAHECLLCACLYGLLMGVFLEASTVVLYAVQPFPGRLAIEWFVANVARSMLMGLLVYVVYRPKPEAAATSD